MNFRMEEQELRWRISRQELEDLCAGTTLKQTTYLPDGRSLGTTITANSNEEDLSLHFENDTIILNVEKGAATALRDTLPRREGIERTQNIEKDPPLRLILEVDIRTQKRKRA